MEDVNIETLIKRFNCHAFARSDAQLFCKDYHYDSKLLVLSYLAFWLPLATFEWLRGLTWVYAVRICVLNVFRETEKLLSVGNSCIKEALNFLAQYTLFLKYKWQRPA